PALPPSRPSLPPAAAGASGGGGGTAGGGSGRAPPPGAGGARRAPRGGARRAGRGGGGATRGRVLAEPSESSDPRRHLEVAMRESAAPEAPAVGTKPVRSHRPLSRSGFGVRRKHLEQAVRERGVPVHVARELYEADAVVTLRNYSRRKPAAL